MHVKHRSRLEDLETPRGRQARRGADAHADEHPVRVTLHELCTVCGRALEMQDPGGFEGEVEFGDAGGLGEVAAGEVFEAA